MPKLVNDDDVAGMQSPQEASDQGIAGNSQFLRVLIGHADHYGPLSRVGWRGPRARRPGGRAG